MDWYEITGTFHQRTFSHDCKLSSLPEEWQRELAALWRLEADVNNGAYLQFLSNWGRESYVYASQALKKIGAARMAQIVDGCQALVDEHFSPDGASPEQLRSLIPNRMIGPSGEIIKESGSILPESVVDRIYELSYEFMEYPDDLPQLGLRTYGRFLQDHAIEMNVERGRPEAGFKPSVARFRSRPLAQFAFGLFGWLSLPIAGLGIRDGRGDIALLGIIGVLGGLYLSRKFSYEDE